MVTNMWQIHSTVLLYHQLQCTFFGERVVLALWMAEVLQFELASKNPSTGLPAKFTSKLPVEVMLQPTKEGAGGFTASLPWLLENQTARGNVCHVWKENPPSILFLQHPLLTKSNTVPKSREKVFQGRELQYQKLERCLVDLEHTGKNLMAGTHSHFTYQGFQMVKIFTYKSYLRNSY